MEVAIIERIIIDNTGQTYSGNVTGNGSYLFTGEYYTSDNNFRPFLRAGLGLFTITSGNVSVNVNGGGPDANFIVQQDNKFGGVLGAGIQFGHGRLAVEYNLVPNTRLATDQNTSLISKNSYVGIKLGVAIGGGRYDR